MVDEPKSLRTLDYASSELPRNQSTDRGPLYGLMMLGVMGLSLAGLPCLITSAVGIVVGLSEVVRGEFSSFTSTDVSALLFALVGGLILNAPLIFVVGRAVRRQRAKRLRRSRRVQSLSE